MPQWSTIKSTEHGAGKEFNFILSNGDKTLQPAGEGYSFTTTFKIPENYARLDVHFVEGEFITGFKFYNKDGEKISELGYAHVHEVIIPIHLKDDEVIMGLRAQPVFQDMALWCNLQFLIRKKW